MSSNSQYPLFPQNSNQDTYAYLPEATSTPSTRVLHRRASSYPNPAPFNGYWQPLTPSHNYSIQQVASQQYALASGSSLGYTSSSPREDFGQYTSPPTSPTHRSIGTDELSADTSHTTVTPDFKKLQNLYSVILNGVAPFTRESSGTEAQPSLAMLDQWIRNASEALRMLDDPQQDLDGSLERSATTWDDVMADDDEDTNESESAVTHTKAHICMTCNATLTPEWRRGPYGPRTLCNACGLVYNKILKRRKDPNAADSSDEEINEEAESDPEQEPEQESETQTENDSMKIDEQ